MDHFRILGFGHAIVDILAKTSLSVIDQHQIQHGGMTLINHKQVKVLLNDLEFTLRAPGGSTANTIRYLANLGHNTGFIGGIGDDDNGNYFKEMLSRSRIEIPEVCLIPKSSNHFSVVCITPESERSMATYINEKLAINSDMLKSNWLNASEYMYIEAYLWNHDQSRESVLKAADMAFQHGKKIILTLADSECIRANHKSISDFCLQKARYVFGNHEEICMLMGTNHIDEAKYKCKQINQITWIITEGKHGACVINGMEYLHLPAVSVPKVVDKTGAGDFFAGGFIHGLLRNKSLQECGLSASKAAAKVIQQIGTGLPFKANAPIQR